MGQTAGDFWLGITTVLSEAVKVIEILEVI